MPSYLHPRSRSTSTLFTTTLAVSFLVVALPHVLPCPVDRRRFADSSTVLDEDGKPTKRKRPSKEQIDGKTLAVDAGVDSVDTAIGGKPQRECPVPKPPGVLGRLFGVQTPQRRPVEVVVQPASQTKPMTMDDKIP